MRSPKSWAKSELSNHGPGLLEDFSNVMRTRRSQFSGNPVSGFAQTGKHRSVLLHEAIEALNIQKGDVIVDATLGGAGHAKEILKNLGEEGTFIGFDADRNAIERAHASLDTEDRRIHLVNANFRTLTGELEKRAIPQIDKALFDLGWSTYQLSEGKGFSFLADEPLDMSYAEGQKLTAAIIVNDWEEESLADVIFGFGEERYSRRIAKAIVPARMLRPIQNARELGEIVKSAVPSAYRSGRLHPATKTFQALRIAVNDELGALKEGLESAWNMLCPGGRLVVITFHSIEDRIVKRLFVGWDKAGEGPRITKKPIVPSIPDLESNPRARSAKLRVIEKNNHA